MGDRPRQKSRRRGADNDPTDDIPTRRHEISAALPGYGDDARPGNGDAAKRERQSAPGTKIIRRQHRIYSAEGKEGRQRETAKYAADDKE
jgi:hypothetical protein